jgi:signal transduction histidine kinase/CheY-like chemotaxis protein
VLVNDLRTEQRFNGPELLTSHGVRSGVSVVIRHEGSAFGILAAHSREPDAFHDEDALFLQTAANLLSAALGRERLEARLARQGRLEALGRLAGGVAHDFNNLLTVILGYADALGQRGMPVEPGLAAQEIRGAAERASALTRDLLAFARQEPGSPVTLDLNAVVTRSLRLMERLVGEDIRLRANLAPEPCLVRADASQIERILVNLVVNARDAQPTGGEIAISTQRSTQSARATVRLVVSDRGSGMAPHVLAHAFEPFFTTKGGGAGSGLGLATVYGLVHQLGGQVSATSRLVAGTQITIELPIATETPLELEIDPPAEVISVRAAAGGTLLVVEDDAVLRGLLVESLERAGYVVLAASDGLAAISIVETHPGPIDALITDIVLPGASGFAVAARVRELRPDTRILYMSGYVGDNGSLAEMERPGVVFVAKPFRIRDLEAALDRKLARSAPAEGAPHHTSAS